MNQEEYGTGGWSQWEQPPPNEQREDLWSSGLRPNDNEGRTFGHGAERRYESEGARVFRGDRPYYPAGEPEQWREGYGNGQPSQNSGWGQMGTNRNGGGYEGREQWASSRGPPPSSDGAGHPMYGAQRQMQAA